MPMNHYLSGNLIYTYSLYGEYGTLGARVVEESKK